MIKAVVHNTIIYGAASLLTKGLVIFLVPLYTRVLSPSDYGVYDLLISLGMLVNITVAMEITQGFARFWVETTEETKRNTLASTCLWFTVMMYGIFLAIGWLAAPQLTVITLGDIRYIDVFRIGVGFLSVNGVFYLLLNQLRFDLRSTEYAIASVVFALSTLLLSLLFCLLFNLGLIGVMVAQLLAAIIASLVCLWQLRKSFSLVFDLHQLFIMLRFSAPLVPASLAVFISLYANRFAINHFCTLEEVGHFAIGSRVAGAAGLLIIGIQAALTPIIYQNYHDPKTPEKISRLFNWFISIALVGCLFLSLFAKELLMLFATSDFLTGATLVGVLAPAILLSQMYIFAPGIGIAKKTVWQLWLTLLSATVSVAANWLAVPIWGIWGAAQATLLTSIVFFSCWLSLSQLLYRIPYAWKEIVLASLGFCLFFALGVEFDAMNLPLTLLIFIKVMLVILFVVSIILCGLFPLTDLKALVQLTRRRLVLRTPI